MGEPGESQDNYAEEKHLNKQDILPDFLCKKCWTDLHQKLLAGSMCTLQAPLSTVYSKKWRFY